ncbi:MAG TPA: hypothetical protein VND93_30630, partial [Myxococcales bacterium]|nr:hypothetical protein [Myxococcales bacterium]
MISPVDPRVPFRELFPYYEQDAQYFFGRDDDTRILLANLLASRVTVVFGASGAGKSSLLRAGVMAQIHRMRNPRMAAAIVSGWGGDPRAVVREAIEAGAGDEADLRRVVERRTSALDDRGRGQLLLILDQFEEYFLYHPPERIADELGKLVADRDLPVSVLISLREDSIGRLDAFKGGI